MKLWKIWIFFLFLVQHLTSFSGPRSPKRVVRSLVTIQGTLDTWFYDLRGTVSPFLHFFGTKKIKFFWAKNIQKCWWLRFQILNNCFWFSSQIHMAYRQHPFCIQRSTWVTLKYLYLKRNLQARTCFKMKKVITNTTLMFHLIFHSQAMGQNKMKI